jgi:hypothetical protein
MSQMSSKNTHLSERATRKPFCDWRTLASYLKRVVESI